MANPNQRITIEAGAAQHTTEKPNVPPGKIMVEAVHRGYWGSMDIEVGESFMIPIEPLDAKSGLPRCFSDWRKSPLSGRSGWMKPVDEVELKKLTDLETAHAKRGGVLAAAPAPAVQAQASALEKQLADLAKEKTALEEKNKALEAQLAVARQGKPAGTEKPGK